MSTKVRELKIDCTDGRANQVLDYQSPLVRCDASREELRRQRFLLVYLHHESHVLRHVVYVVGQLQRQNVVDYFWRFLQNRRSLVRLLDLRKGKDFLSKV